MALSNVLLLSQVAGYVAGLLLSVCTALPLALHLHEFRGHCLLFSEGTWQEADGQMLVSWASCGYCNYVIFTGVLLFITSCTQIYRLSRLLLKGEDSSFLSAFVEAVWCVIGCVLSLTAAIFITLGFMTWCQNIMERFPSCEMAAGQDIDKKDKISTNGYYFEMGVAQFGAWGAFATWVDLSVFSLLKVCRYHQLENIRVSMYRERQRLVNEGSPGGSPGGSLDRFSTPPAQQHT